MGPPTYEFARSSTSLSTNGDPSHEQNTPPGSDRGTTGTLPTKRTFSSCISYGLHHYSQAPVPFGPQKWDRLKYSKQTNSATSRQNRRSRIKKGKKDGDEYEATWRRDAKLVRVPRVDPSIQLVDGRPLTSKNVIDAKMHKPTSLSQPKSGWD